MKDVDIYKKAIKNLNELADLFLTAKTSIDGANFAMMGMMAENDIHEFRITKDLMTALKGMSLQADVEGEDVIIKLVFPADEVKM